MIKLTKSDDPRFHINEDVLWKKIIDIFLDYQTQTQNQCHDIKTEISVELVYDHDILQKLTQPFIVTGLRVKILQVDPHGNSQYYTSPASVFSNYLIYEVMIIPHDDPDLWITPIINRKIFLDDIVGVNVEPSEEFKDFLLLRNL